MDSQKSAGGIFISIMYCCFIIAATVLTVTHGIVGNSVFKPTSYTLGDVYDAETVQLAEAFQTGYQTDTQMVSLDKAQNLN